MGVGWRGWVAAWLVCSVCVSVCVSAIAGNSHFCDQRAGFPGLPEPERRADCAWTRGLCAARTARAEHRMENEEVELSESDGDGSESGRTARESDASEENAGDLEQPDFTAQGPQSEKSGPKTRTQRTPTQTSLKPCECTICVRHSNEEGVLWYQYLLTRNLKGAVVKKIATGDFCKRCGTAANDVYVRMTLAEIKVRRAQDAAWAKEFDEVALKLEARIQSELLQQQVEMHEMRGVEVYIKVAFIEQAKFEAKFAPVARFGYKLSTVPHPTMTVDVKGILCSKASVPKDVPHMIVKLSARKYWTLKEIVLDNDELLTHSHARDIFAHEVTNNRHP